MDRQAPTRLMATSPDGTPIAYWRSGQGPPLLLVHGSLADHTRWETVRPLLEPHVTVHVMDRRGRGASGDADGYTLAAEAADVAAVVGAIAEAIGGPVDLFGHSYGALCALEATLLTTRIRRLALYEPAIGPVTPPGLIEHMADLLAQGRREEVVIALFRDLLQTPDDLLARLRSDPSWPGRVAAAHTIVRESLAEEDYRLEPERFSSLTVSAMLMTGSNSVPDVAQMTAELAAVLPDASVVTLAGQGHIAMTTAPELFVAELLGFLRADRTGEQQ